MSQFQQTPGETGRIHLLGAFGVFGPNDTDHTPNSKKAQAILAMLALAPRGTRTRVWLRDKLWSESDEIHASNSLRQTVFELKKALGPLADDIFVVARNTLTLRLSRVWVDIRVATDNPGGLPLDASRIDLDADLLEGMDICDEEFEDWLLIERSSWEGKKPAQNHPAPAMDHQMATVPPTVIRETQPIIDIGLLSNITHGNSEGGEFIGDLITESVASSMSEYQPVNVIDLRDEFQDAGPLNMRQQVDYLIRARILSVGDTVSITFLVYSANSTSLLLSQSMQTTLEDLMRDDLSLVNQFIAQNVDHLAKILSRTPPVRDQLRNDLGYLVGYNILADMFDLDPKKMGRGLRRLQQVDFQQDNSLFPSLIAYSSSFAMGENIGSDTDQLLEETEKICLDVLQKNPFNSISLACLGHVFGYVFNKHDIAEDLFSRAIKLNPMQAFVWDHYALHKMYIGDLQSARFASNKAVQLGSYSPINYTYETTACMIASMVGDHNRAVELGQRALVKQPRFHAAMRYSLASLGHLGNFERAEPMRRKLLGSDPEFADPETQRRRFRLPLSDAQEHVLKGIQKVGL